MDISQTNFHGDDEIQQGDVVEDIDCSHASSSSSSPSYSSHDLDRGNKIQISFNMNDGDEEEEDVCRICRNPGDADNPLRYPCACSGSIKFVHQDCLLQWLSHSNARQCEICKHPFSFSPLYAENAPEKLPLQEIIFGMTMKGCRILKFFLRLCFVLSVWLLIIPFITFWIWRLAFVRSFGEAQWLFLSHISTVVILTDCLHGFLLSASIVFIFVGATSLRDYFRQLRELGRNAANRGDDGERNGARIGRIPAPVNANLEREGNGENIGPQGIAGAGQMIRRNAENIAARWEMQAARLEAHVEQMFDGLDDADVAEDVPFDELVGMQGPVFHFVENAFTLLASNMIFFGVVIFAPFTLGRIILSYLLWAFPSASDSLTAVIPLKESAFALANISMKIEIPAAAINVSAERIGQITELLKVNSSGLSHITNNISSPLQVDVLNGVSTGNSRISDVTTLAVGYMFILSLVLFYLAVVDLIRHAKGEPLTTGTLHGFTSMSESIPSLIRQFFSATRHLITMTKVAFLLVIELGLFPLMCGWWMDICTLRMFGKSFTQRVEFFSVSPLASSLIHWVAGIAYMLQISIFVSLLRGVLRNGVLYFLRDPADPNYNPFRDLIDDPMHKHARRVLLSVAVYGSLILMLVFLPVMLAMRVAPRIFPLDISVSDPFTEIPADVLLFQIYIPFAVEHFKLRTTIKSLLHNWFTAVGWALGLTDFLLPMPDENADYANDRDQEQPGVHPGQNMVVQDHSDDLTANFPVDSAADDSDSEQSDLDCSFVLRIVLLLVLAWITLLICNSSIILVPVSLGRVLFNSLSLGPFTHGIKNNDIYAFIIGSYVIWSAVAGARYSAEHIGMRRTSILLTQMWKWFTIVVKSSILLSLWVFVIPVLIGVLFELLVIVPIRVPVDESPVFLLYQDWALGLIFLKIWTRLVMLDNVMPGDEGWKMKFERVRQDGFSGLRGVWVLKEILLPVMTKLLTALCFPYVLARGVVPVLRLPLVVNSAVYRFSWLGCLSFTLACFCAKRCPTWFGTVHDAIRDDRYLIGRRLHNFRELDAGDDVVSR